MIIPISELSKQTLINLVESFVLREGTDYGEHEVSLSDKVGQVLAQLESGELILVYSELHQSVNIVSQEQYSEGE